MANLAERTMLVDFGFSTPKLTAVDKAATAKAVADAGTKKGRARVVKSLYADEDIKMVTRFRDEVRTFHYRMTLPWMHNGPRILASELFMDYSARMRDYRAQWEVLVSSFVDNYHDRIERSRADLSGMFNEADYPRPAEVKESFDMRVNMLPVPTAGDFRVSIGDEAMAEITASMAHAEAAAVELAMAEVKERIVKYVGNMAKSLQRGTKIFDTVVTNVQDLIDILPALNLNDDPRIIEVQRDIERHLINHHPDDLKQDKALAESVGAEAQKVVDKMAAYFG